MEQEEEDLTKEMGGGKERHFSYYAYAGMTGTRRWVHRSEVRTSFRPDCDRVSYYLSLLMTLSSTLDHYICIVGVFIIVADGSEEAFLVGLQANAYETLEMNLI